MAEVVVGGLQYLYTATENFGSNTNITTTFVGFLSTTETTTANDTQIVNAGFQEIIVESTVNISDSQNLISWIKINNTQPTSWVAINNAQ